MPSATDSPGTPVLLTGGAGYVGSHVAKALHESGYVPVVLDTLERGLRERVKWGPLVVGDAGDQDLVRRTLREHSCSAVIHAAAYAFVGESVLHPAAYHLNNLVVPLKLFEVAEASGVAAFVFSSTCSVYGDPGLQSVSESAPLAPISPYGRAKAVAERELALLSERSGLPLVSLRLFNAVGNDPGLAIGESDYRQFGRLVPDALRAATTGERLRVSGEGYPTPDGSPQRDYVHVEDLARGHVLALARALDGKTLTCNLSTGRPTSVREVLRVVERVSGRPIDAAWVAMRPGDPVAIVGRPDLASHELGWRTAWSVEDAIEHAWNWWNATHGEGAGGR